eukprot:7123537-Pyramimonas_sp.AAC.3
MAQLLKIHIYAEKHRTTGIDTKEALADTPGVEVTKCARSELPEHLEHAHVLVPLMTKLTAAEIEKATSAKLIQQFGVGLEVGFHRRCPKSL